MRNSKVDITSDKEDMLLEADDSSQDTITETAEMLEKMKLTRAEKNQKFLERLADPGIEWKWLVVMYH